jgi:O-succinylhomoserine sulfhydrylase
VAQSCRSAAAIADHLAGQAAIERVLYPFRADHPQAALARAQMSEGGTLVTFALRGGQAAAFRFLNALELVVISNNLGDSKSMMTHPATTTHSKIAPADRAVLGITEGIIRFSVGLEDVADLIDDLDGALKAVG